MLPERVPVHRRSTTIGAGEVPSTRRWRRTPGRARSGTPSPTGTLNRLLAGDVVLRDTAAPSSNRSVTRTRAAVAARVRDQDVRHALLGGPSTAPSANPQRVAVAVRRTRCAPRPTGRRRPAATSPVRRSWARRWATMSWTPPCRPARASRSTQMLTRLLAPTCSLRRRRPVRQQVARPTTRRRRRGSRAGRTDRSRYRGALREEPFLGRCRDPGALVARLEDRASVQIHRALGDDRHVVDTSITADTSVAGATADPIPGKFSSSTQMFHAAGVTV